MYFEKIKEYLSNLEISENKLKELESKHIILDHIEKVMELGFPMTKLQYTLCCMVPLNFNIENISKAIHDGMIQHKDILKGLIKNKITEKDQIEDFIEKNDINETDLVRIIDSKKNNSLSKMMLMKEVKKEVPFADTCILLRELENYSPITTSNKEKGTSDESEKEGFSLSDWLTSGELSKLKKPSQNLQQNDQALLDHLARTNGVVVTRFPPEPNGTLHIGHAKAINLSFEYAKKYGGFTYLRYDDTNPKNESEKFYSEIEEDLKWLGFEPKAITASSDYFEKMFEMCRTLIINGDAYVCFLSNEELKRRRILFQAQRDLGNADPSILSPYRNFPVEKNLRNYLKMRNGDYCEGEACLRFKMDSHSKNPHMLDLVGLRIIDCVHPRHKKNFYTYPTYEFALCVCDSLEDVTHSFCSREFYTRQEPYHWLLKKLNLYEPIQWEFSKLLLSHTVISKRRLTKIVEQGLGWDDPRLFTISGMRRRGFPPSAINKFVQSVGFTFSDTVIDVKALENIVRKELYTSSKKIFGIFNPLKVVVQCKRTENIEGVDFVIDNCIYIDSSDFCENPEKDFLRLSPENPVGLLGLGKLSYLKSEKEYIVCELELLNDNENFTKPAKFIQWLPHLNNTVSLQLYSPLFHSFVPSTENFLDEIDLSGSLSIEKGYVDDRILTAAIGERFQIVRKGFFVVDQDSILTDDRKIILNRTLEIKTFY